MEISKQFKGNRVAIDGETAKVFFKDGSFFTVDLADLDLVKSRTWCKKSNGLNSVYVVSNQRCGHRNRQIYLHRLLLALSEGIVDHKNGNGLDNRRSNLRIATKAENARNTAQVSRRRDMVKCVYYHKKQKSFMVRLNFNGKSKFMGYRKTKEEAESLAIELKNRYYGDFSPHQRN